MHLLDRVLVAGRGEGLEYFHNLPEFRRLGLEEGVLSGVRDMSKLRALRDVPHPTVLSMSCDQEAKQISAIAFMKHRLNLTCEVCFDWFHRCWNDIKQVLRETGLHSTYLQSLLIFNVAHGPWESSAWFHAMVETAGNLSQCLEADSPVVLRLWPRILQDRGLDCETADEVVGAQARAAWVKELQLNRTFIVKGDRCSLSRWFSWHLAFDGWDRDLHTRAAVLVTLCYHKGWALAAEDLFAADMTGPTAGPEGSSSTAATSKSAKEKVEALRRRAKNTLHAASLCMCDADFVCRIRIIAHFTRPLYTDFSHTQRTFKGEDASQAFFEANSQFKWLEPLKGVLRAKGDLRGLGRAGFEVHFARHDAARVQTEARCAYEDSRRCACRGHALHRALGFVVQVGGGRARGGAGAGMLEVCDWSLCLGVFG